MKFTTLLPTTWNDGTAIKPSLLSRVIDELWRPFGGMSNEGLITGRWVKDGIEFADVSVKISIACERDQLIEAIRAVRRVGRRLRQRAMYLEVDGYDGVQILHIP